VSTIIVKLRVEFFLWQDRRSSGPEFSKERWLAFMEFIRPMPTWDDFVPGAIETF
jgi:hypothetical protein